MGRTPLRGASLRLSNKFQTTSRLRRQDAGANIGAADGPKGEAREVPSNMVRLLYPQTKTKDPPLGRVFCFGWETRIRT